MNMDFGASKTPVEIIKEGAFRRTYCRDTYLSINGKRLRNMGQSYYCSNYYDVSVNKHNVKCETSLRFWKK